MEVPSNRTLKKSGTYNSRLFFSFSELNRVLNDSDLFSVSSLSSHSLSDLADYDDIVVDQNKLFGQAAYPNAMNEFAPPSAGPGRSLSVSPISSPSTNRTSLSYTSTPDRDVLRNPLHPR